MSGLFSLLADPKAINLLAVIRCAALVPKLDQAVGFGDFKISRVCGEAGLPIEMADQYEITRIAPLRCALGSRINDFVIPIQETIGEIQAM